MRLRSSSGIRHTMEIIIDDDDDDDDDCDILCSMHI